MTTERRVFAGLTVFMGLMTTAWSSNALETLPIIAVIGMVLGVLAVIMGAVGLVRGRRAPRSAIGRPRSAQRDREHGGLVSGRAAGIFAGLEVLLIPLVCVLLGRTGHGALVVPAVAFIVAAHFALFRLVQDQMLHVVAAVVGCLGAGMAIVLVLHGDLDPAAGRALAGLTLAACTAAYASVFARQAWRRA
ncbi:hypothetical protein [Brachybacterium kimchii]|uniref:Uncharacterized protein n=1 Tax=Brachybacterium kimchii TaxID=2942909 RepID=A0ABY4N1C9_9MICO|nr:hypothetical protein [Brachybacterium kimchii]UQN28352.1 hypothetical protein M4486_11920 [Brachybacterium kimchii]